MEVTPTNPSLAIQSALQLIATGTYSDNSTGDFTHSATWSSSDTTKATVSSSGLVTGIAAGTATITATSGDKSGSTTVTVTHGTLQSISVTPANPSIAKGTTKQFTATGTYSDNSTQDLTTQVTWASDTTGVATISSAGLATAAGVGTAKISATMGSVSGSTNLTVTQATLQSIAVTPPNPSLAVGTTQQFTATGTYSDTSTQDLTTQVTWASDTTSVATISSAGMATAVAVGTARISATLGSISGSTVLTVTPASLQSIAVTPANPSIAKGTTKQFTATGTYSDTSTQDLTTQVTWASDTPAVATVSNAAGSKGLATAVTVGAAKISATLGSISGSTTLTVTPATLQSISVTPPAPSIAKGTTQQFVATGTYSDGSTQTLTTQVTWASSATGVATISNAAGSQGLASTLTTGTTAISATLGAISGHATLTVTPATLSSISVTPTTPSRPVPLTLAFEATGIFTDGTTQDLTNAVTWASSNTAAATISNAAGSKGLSSTVAAGMTTISATQGAVSGSTVFTVTAATVSSIAVTPTNPSIAAGTTQQFAATGMFSDGSNFDLTQLATWSSDQTGVATISNAAGSQGLATGLTQGTANISAAFGGVTGSTTLTVTAATLVSIAVTPANPSVPRGLTQQFTATGTFTDGSTQDLTTSVSWSSSDGTVASIANAGAPGLATALSQGTTTIKAVQGTVSGSTTMTVTSAVLVSIAVTPADVTIPKSSTQQFIALGTFSDTSVVDLTTQVTWTSSDPTVVAISNAALSQGLATALTKGMVTITATKGAVSGTAKAKVP